MLEERTPQRSAGTLFGDLGERLARTFGGGERAVSRWDQETVSWQHEQEGTRFPAARLGYDREAVDRHVAELERQLSELRANGSPRQAVAAEIERIGEQTASILKVAHEQAREITREAQRQADTCLADAAANAVAITEEANRKLRELDGETETVWQERARLIEDARSVATALFTLAEEASERFPGEGDRAAGNPQPVAAVAADAQGGAQAAPEPGEPAA